MYDNFCGLDGKSRISYPDEDFVPPVWVVPSPSSSSSDVPAAQYFDAPEPDLATATVPDPDLASSVPDLTSSSSSSSKPTIPGIVSEIMNYVDIAESKIRRRSLDSRFTDFIHPKKKQNIPIIIIDDEEAWSDSEIQAILDEGEDLPIPTVLFRY